MNSPNIREQVKGKGENERLFCSQQPDITRFLDCAHDGKDVVAYIWSWVVKCPNCGFENPLVGQWWLVRKKKKKLYLNPSVDEGSLHIEIETGNNAPEGTCSNGKGRCLGCGSSISNETIKEDISKREKEILLAVVVSGRKGKNYGLPSDIDFLAFERARSQVKESWKLWEKDGLLPLEEIPKDTRGSLSVKIYLKDWHRLLNPRQTLLFTTLVKNIRNYGHKISEDYDEEYGKALAVYLSFVFGKHIDYNSRSSSWHRTNQQISSATGRRGVAIMWDHAEVNPFVKGSGTLLSMIQNILAGVNYSINKLAYGEVYAEVKYDSITSLNERIPLIVTDPPYYDDVRYAEFSEFFYSWERKALELFFEFGDVPKAEEMSVGGWGRTPEFFNTLFRLSCKKMHAMLTDDGMLVMFFAHSSVDAWDFVINSLQGARFRITATWPVHTESSVSLIARDHASIMSSIIIVARKRESEKSGYIEEIQEDVHDYLAKRLEEFWDYGLKGADLTVAAMGATLDIITQYSEIKSYTGEMKIKDILELVQGYVAEYVLNRYIEHSSGLDTATSFYLYSKLSQLDKMPYDTANLIAKSINVDLKIFQDHGLVALRKSGRSKGVMLLNYAEREFNGVNSLIDAVHLIMIAFSRGGYAEAEEELARVPYGRNEIKNILVAFQSLPPEDQERQVSQRILERMGYAFPKEGQMEIGRY